MSIPKSLDQLETQSYVESTTVANVPAVRVVNPDGTNISGGGGGGTVDQGTGGASAWLIKIDQTGTNNDVDANVTAVVPGVAATSLGKAEDAAHTSGDTGVAVWAVRNDAGGPLAGTTGDYIPFTTDSNGNLRVVASGSTVTQYAEDTAHVSGDLGFEMLSKRTDTAASSAGSDGDYATVNTDNLGHVWSREGYAAVAEDNTNGVFAEAIMPLAVSTYSWNSTSDFGSNVTLNIKATSGNVKAFYCHNLNGSARFLQLHNTATTPGAGNIPLFSFLVPANGVALIDGQFFGENGKNFTTGIAYGFSTTEGTYTAGVAADQTTTVMWK